MDRERLTRLLEEPGRVAREDLGDLKALTERYPWFSGAQLLRVAGEQAAGDVLFNETLNSATAHLPSRAVLFDLVEQRDQQAPVQPRPEARILQMPVKDPVRVIHPEPLPAEEEEDPSIEDAQDPIGTEPGATGKAANTAEEDEDPLGRQIMEAALASAYDLTWQDQGQSASRASQVPSEIGAARSASTSPSSQPVAPAAGVRLPTPEAAPHISPGSRLRFTDWLAAAEPAAETEPPHGPGSAVPASSKDWLHSTPTAPADAPVSPADTRELIDRFMRQQIPEPTHKAEFFTPQQAAKRSLDDTAGLVTETLARIYEKQGNLPKAIETYRRLALKYPHKSGYFAALQKSLEEQLNK